MTNLIREFLLTLRSLIDWYLERLDAPKKEREVEDIERRWERELAGVEFAVEDVPWVEHTSPDEVVLRLPIGPHLHQPYGIVHGGVHCGVVETLASVGAAR